MTGQNSHILGVRAEGADGASQCAELAPPPPDRKYSPATSAPPSKPTEANPATPPTEEEAKVTTAPTAGGRE